MTLQELTTRLQALCHDGWSLNEVEFLICGELSRFEAGDVKLILKSESAAGGEICVKLGS